jgi:hypothetical protein
MQAIEFEAVPKHHMIRVPDGIPDNVPMRVLLLIDEQDAPLVAETKPVRNPGYEKFTVEKIVIPPRDELYER